jgi:hypothetical protein
LLVRVICDINQKSIGKVLTLGHEMAPLSKWFREEKKKKTLDLLTVDGGGLVLDAILSDTYNK